MSDKSLIFTIGLTNVKDTDGIWTVESDSELPEYNTSYNLYKQHPDVEKASLSWKLNMEKSLVAKLIYRWEETIRKPHLKMITSRHSPLHYDKQYFNMALTLEHIPLLPSDNNETYTNQELLDLDFYPSKSNTWGALTLDLSNIFHYNGCIMNYLRYQLDDLRETGDFDIVDAETVKAQSLEIPANLSFNLELMQQKRSPASLSFNSLDKHHRDIFEEYKSEFSDLGYDKELYAKLINAQSLAVGEPMQTPSVLYDTFSKYPTVCRTSLTKEE